MANHTSDPTIDRRTVLRAAAGAGVGAAAMAAGTGTTTAHGKGPARTRSTVTGGDSTDNDTQTVVDFDWSYPRCPDQEVGELGRYFFGDLGYPGGFHLDEGDGAAESPSGCVLRTDGEEALTISLPDGHTEQSATLEQYPRRGQTITFDHYVHREGANMEFRFAVQDDVDSHYAVRFETANDEPALYLLRVEAGRPEVLDQVSDLSYSAQQFHEFEIEWLADEISVTLFQDGMGTTIAGVDDTYDHGGIAFYKERTGTIRSYAHLWNDVEVTMEPG